MVVQRDNTKVYTIDEIRSIVLPFIELRGMRWAGLFGSYARGDANNNSDIDVLVDKGNARAFRFLALQTTYTRTREKELMCSTSPNCLMGLSRTK